MGLDILTTKYANSIGISEKNIVMSFIVNNLVLFILIKLIYSIFAILTLRKVYYMKNYKKHSIAGMRLIIGLMLFVVLGNGLVIFGSAVDNVAYNPTCLEPSYDTGYKFLVTSNIASLGDMNDVDITAGYFSPSQLRMYNGVNILCMKPDPTTSGSIAGISRVFGTSEDGSIWYFDSIPVNYSSGFYTVGTPTSLFKIGTLSSTTLNRKIAIDSNGNVYTNDGAQIVKYTKALDYTQSNFYTLTRNIDFTSTNAFSVDVCGMQFDSSNNLHVLVCTSATSDAGGIRAEISKTMISPLGVFVGADLTLASATSSSPSSASSSGGGLIIDSVNPRHNYTYAYVISGTVSGTTYALKHNSSAGTSTIATLTGITSIGGLGYNNFVVYLTSPGQNLIRGYTTSFAGYNQPQQIGTVVSGLVSYVSHTITVPAPTYYNDSKIPINWNLQFGMNSTTMSNYGSLLAWKIFVTDPNGAISDIHTISISCNPDLPWWDTFGVIAVVFGANAFYCSPDYAIVSPDNGLSYLPPPTNWVNGTYTVSLIESYLGNNAVLSIDYYIILNVSNPNTGGLTNPKPQGGSLPPSNQSNTGNPTMDNIINFLQMPAFWGILIFVFVVLGVAWKAPSAVGIVALIISNLEAIIGLWVPYTIYVFIVTWIIAAIFFTIGRKTTTGGD
jgi:hypothetical protein